MQHITPALRSRKMTTKEISVFIIGILLVGFLYLMKHPMTSQQELVITDNQTAGIGILTDDNINHFNPQTDAAPIETILDIPAWKLGIEELKSQTSEELNTAITKAIAQERYFQPEKDNALYYFMQLKAINTENANENDKIIEEKLTNRLQALSQIAIAKSDNLQLTTLIAKLKTLNADKTTLATLNHELATIKTINRLFKKGLQQIADNKLITADSQDAWHTAKQCQELAASNPKTLELISKVNADLINNALLAAEETDFNLAENQLQQAKMLNPSSTQVQQASNKIANLKQQRYVWLEQQITQAIKQINIPRAKRMLTQLGRIGLQTSQLQEYQNEIERIKNYGKYRPFEDFQVQSSTTKQLPTMTVMPIGQFIMGNKSGTKYQSPEHIVSLMHAFAVSKTEITVANFRQFIQASNYRTDADQHNSSRIYDARTGRLKSKRRMNWQKNYLGKKAQDNNPVIHVSWNDAQAYVKWLTTITGKKYRLLSEAEFEYILKAGSHSYYPWGEGSPKSIIENLTGKLDKFSKNSRISWSKGFENYTDGYWGPAPVGSFIVNQYHLYDTAGNVMEWVEDCWHDSYVRAPDNGKSWINSGCQSHVIRGGSWSSGKTEFASAHRFKANSDFRDARLGFRIALDLK